MKGSVSGLILWYLQVIDHDFVEKRSICERPTSFRNKARFNANLSSNMWENRWKFQKQCSSLERIWRFTFTVLKNLDEFLCIKGPILRWVVVICEPSNVTALTLSNVATVNHGKMRHYTWSEMCPEVQSAPLQGICDNLVWSIYLLTLANSNQIHNSK